MRMVQAAESAAAAVTAAQSLLSRNGAEDSKSWWKLPKPPVFGHGSREAEISAWREWSWTFEQYISSVDPKFADDIQSVRADLDRSVDPVDF